MLTLRNFFGKKNQVRHGTEQPEISAAEEHA